MPIPYLWACLSVAIVMGIVPGPAGAEEGIVTVTFPVKDYILQKTPRGDELLIEDFGRLLVPGKPDLPARIFSIAIPPGAEVTSVRFECKETCELQGTYNIPPSPLPRIAGEEDPAFYRRDLEQYDSNHAAVYGSNDPYPGTPCELITNSGYRKYNLVDVRITPFVYRPESKKLAYHPEVTVHVHYRSPDPRQAAMDDNMVRTETIAREIVYNYDQAQAWYPRKGPAESRGLHDFVIVTLPSLASSVQPLVDWETEKGRTVKVVTTDWIAASYPGYDLQERIRNFLRHRYPSGEWGIRDLLIIGHAYQVPTRLCEYDPGYGKPHTDFYYSELSLPDSLSWDLDGDHLYGEETDPIDFLGEINVGRIPWSDPATVKKVAEKCATFENTSDPAFKKNILLLGSFFWPNTDSAAMMEYKTDPLVHPWMNEWASTSMYEQNGACYSSYECDHELHHDNVMKIWSSNKFAFANMAGHGNYTGCFMKGYGGASMITVTDCPNLNDRYPAIVFTLACSTSASMKQSLGHWMIRNGGVGYLGATKIAYAMPGWSHPLHGSGQSFDYYFTSCVTAGNHTQGEAHQWALRRMYTHGLWYLPRNDMFIWSTFYGNPCLGLGTVPCLRFSFPGGLPEDIRPPGIKTRMTVKIEDGEEQFVPGSGFFHYRLRVDDPFLTLPLTPVGIDSLEARLPPTRPDDVPEYYFSAVGHCGTFYTSPYYAPAKTYSFDVALKETILSDDFETDQGWTVNNLLLNDGEWERADPSGTCIGPDPVQPEDDHSPFGTKCFVTGKSGGTPEDDDVDGGYTSLVSPVFDLAGTDGFISFYYWFYHSDTGLPLPMSVQINNGSASNTKVMETGHAPQWNHFSFRVSDHIKPTDEMFIEIRASDFPNDDIVEALIDDVRIERLNRNPSLWADVYTIPKTEGGVVNLHLDAGASNASRLYIVLGSLSGIEPGIPLPGGTARLPLRWDAATEVIWTHLNSAQFRKFLGKLDVEGRGAARMTLPALPPGSEEFHCYLAFALFYPCDYVSSVLTLTIEERPR